MKRLLGRPAVQGALALVTAAYAELVTATLRWSFEPRARERVEAAVRAPGGIIALFWHRQIGAAIACRPLLRGRAARVMISLSRDGEFIARAAERLGVPPVRGSTGREGIGAKGGAAALREAITALRSGGVMLITPDGPRGPAESLSMGALQLARLSGAQVFLLGLATRPALRLGGWDSGELPLPFARAGLSLEGPLSFNDAAPVGEPIRRQWERGLRDVQQRAERLIGR